MTDLGFGLADKRSVLAVLFTAVFSLVVFRNPIPIDSSNALTLLFGLTILTGFIYFARSLIRLVIALILGFVFFLLSFYSILIKGSDSDKEWLRNTPNIFRSAVSDFLYGVLSPLFLQRDWDLRTSVRIGARHLVVIGIIDRISLITIVYLATLPASAPYRDPLGLVGVAVLIIIYALTGRFTFILQDAFHKAEDQHDALVEAAGRPAH